jgi:nucleobase:cation symporter-1, NCS1 family
MPAVIADFDSRAAKFFTAFSFMLATIGNQVAAGTYPFSNDVSGLYPKYINIFRATLVISVFCVACTPWNIIKNAAGLIAFLSGYSAFMGSVAGVMVSQYYFILNKKLNIHELYNGQGIYRFWHGINWRAYAAFAIGVGPLMPGFAHSINNNLQVGGSWQIYTFSCVYGFFTSCLSYYLICRFVSDVGPAKIDVAIYPAEPGREVEDIESGQDTVYGEKGTDIREKEVPPSPE